MPLGDALKEYLDDSRVLQRKKAAPALAAWDALPSGPSSPSRHGGLLPTR